MDDTQMLEATTRIAASYLARNPSAIEQLPGVIGTVFDALMELFSGNEPDAPTAAVDVKKSVFNDHIICLEDGKPFKVLRKHLRTEHGLSEDEYREKWGLPESYPMVAPGYAAIRSKLAKASGLGTLTSRHRGRLKPK